MKRAIILLCAVMLTLSLTACGSESSQEKGETETETMLGIDDTLSAENFDFTILSADVVSSVTNALGVEYTADDGYELLIIVFSATNTSDETMNVENVDFNSYVDDKKISIKSVVGEIAGYTPLLGAVDSGKTFEGYTVWQLPDDWEKLEFSYIDALSGSESGLLTILATDIK